MSRNQNKQVVKLNTGMTLVELLVALAILAIMTTVAVIGIGILSSGDSKKASGALRNALGEVRTSTLSIESSWEAVIRNNDGKFEVAILKDGSETEVYELGTRIDITFFDSKTAAENTLDNGDELVVTFNKSSGSVNKLMYKGSEFTMEGSSLTFLVNSSSKGEYEVVLWYATGKVTGKE